MSGLIWLAALLLAYPACADTPPAEPRQATGKPPTFQTAPSAGYIVSARHGDDIRRHYGSYGIRVLRDLGGRHFELQLEQDPGLDTMNTIAADSQGAIGEIQENLRYRSF